MLLIWADTHSVKKKITKSIVAEQEAGILRPAVNETKDSDDDSDDVAELRINLRETQMQRTVFGQHCESVLRGECCSHNTPQGSSDM